MRSSAGEVSSFSSTRFKNERAFYDFVWLSEKEIYGNEKQRGFRFDLYACALA